MRSEAVIVSSLKAFADHPFVAATALKSELTDSGNRATARVASADLA